MSIALVAWHEHVSGERESAVVQYIHGRESQGERGEDTGVRVKMLTWWICDVFHARDGGV